jgi:hypothetical protein
MSFSILAKCSSFYFQTQCPPQATAKCKHTFETINTCLGFIDIIYQVVVGNEVDRSNGFVVSMSAS